MSSFRLLLFGVFALLFTTAEVTSLAGTTDVVCPRAADIVLVLDQSTSIVVENYENWYVNVLGFASSVAGAFPIAPDLTQVGLMKFSSGVEVVFHLNEHGDRESLLRAIQSVDINGGDTNIAAALRAAREVMFDESNGARPGVPKILIMLTDGSANLEQSNTVSEADLTKAAGIIIYTIGVTHEVDDEQLREIASSPDYFFFASDFTQLNGVLQYLVENSCKEAATLPTTTTTITPRPDLTCVRAADIVLMLDQSTSIVVQGYDNWYVNVLGFARSVAGAFPISPDLTQVGLMKFSDDIEVVFYLNEHGDRESLLRAMQNININLGDTNIAAALRTAREVMFDESNGARPGLPKILIMLTDGTANLEESNTVSEADLTKAAGIIIYTVGVTHEVDEEQLREIASNPDHFFFASDFAHLNDVLQNLVENSCQEAATLPTTRRGENDIGGK